MNDSIKTMLNFALKSRQIIIGIDNILRTHSKPCEVLFVDNALATNSLDKLKRICDKYRILLLMTDFVLTLAVPIEGCKVLGVTDHNMCLKIIKEAQNNTNYQTILGGNNLG